MLFRATQKSKRTIKEAVTWAAFRMKTIEYGVEKTIQTVNRRIFPPTADAISIHMKAAHDIFPPPLVLC